MKKKLYFLLVKTPIITIIAILFFLLLSILICVMFNVFS